MAQEAHDGLDAPPQVGLDHPLNEYTPLNGMSASADVTA
jgi:hypothetical protein